MRVVVDYRPALRARSGVGEYVHQAARAFAAAYPTDQITLFTSSWKDRPDPNLLAECRGARVSDHRVPVAALNFAWHRLEWPPVERMIGSDFDVAFSPHPLLMPARRAAQVVMIHDLDFLRHPERTAREVRRDYPRFARPHAARAARVIVPSAYTAAQVVAELGVARERVVVCPPGVPDWPAPADSGFDPRGYVLFVGTLEPRKNLGRLLDGYGRLRARTPNVPPLVIAGRPGADARTSLDAIARPPLRGHVEYRGYVPQEERQRMYAGARVLVLPSLEEGFGMPALEAMSLGIPVVVSDRGALPALVGDAGLLVDPEDVESIVAALDRVLGDDSTAQTMSRRGLARSSGFQWTNTAAALRDAFQLAIDARRLSPP